MRVLRPGGDWLVPVAEAPPEIAGILASERDGRCVFHRPAGGTRSHGDCEIHHGLGHSALPSACQHFPRECLIDPRGVFVTLSHYCPTAASLLFNDADVVTIVEGPRAIPTGDPEGLDARDALPPLLRPGMLMDHASYSLWEAHMVRALTGSDYPPESALDALERDVQRLTDWWPSHGALAGTVAALNARVERSSERSPDWPRERALFVAAVESLTTHRWPCYPQKAECLWREKVAGGWSDYRGAIGRFLAAHAFASWWAYQGSGVRSQIARLRLALAVLRAESIRVCLDDNAALDAEHLKRAIRQTDLLLVHLIDRGRLAAHLAMS